jgi:2-polyprenyl-6-methoxyphenol hydroxylase-like FAD-dependent oxidoreductase
MRADTAEECCRGERIVRQVKILVIGGGIGGLTSAIALRKQGFDVDVVEKDPDWAVYGVGIIQQSNVIRAMDHLGLLEDYLDVACGFDFLEVYLPTGVRVARVPTPKLVPGYPANIGVTRTALHKVLGDRTLASGAKVRLGVTVARLAQDADGVDVAFSDGSAGRYAVVIGADGVYSTTRRMLFPDAPEPEFVGQGVWRYNFRRPADLDCLRAYEGPVGVGLVPLSPDLMYMFVTTPEPGNPRYPREGLAATMRSKVPTAAPAIAALAQGITDDDGVVYKPLECIFLDGPWHKGRVVLLGDAVHATTPHLGQGAGMAIEDSIVLAEELAAAENPGEAFSRYRARRFDRVDYIVRQSRAICDGQLGRRPPVNQAEASRAMFDIAAQPI